MRVCIVVVYASSGILAVSPGLDTGTTTLAPLLLHVHLSNANSGFSARKMPYTAGGPGCCTVQVVLANVHCWWSRLPYTVGDPGCCTVQVVLANVHCWWSRLPYTVGDPGCCTVQVVLANVHCRWPRLLYSAGGPGCRTL